jgi:hypothetical protein
MSTNTITQLLEDNADVIAKLPVRHTYDHSRRIGASPIAVEYILPARHEGALEGMEFLDGLAEAGGIKKTSNPYGNGETLITFKADPKAHKSFYEIALPIADRRLQEAKEIARSLTWSLNKSYGNTRLVVDSEDLTPEQKNALPILLYAGEAGSEGSSTIFRYTLDAGRHALFNELEAAAQERRDALIKRFEEQYFWKNNRIPF